MILASVITYALAKQIGSAEAEREFSRQCNALVDEPGHLPAARTIRKLRRFGDVAKLHDAGGTSIGHARSRAFSVALRAAQEGKLDHFISIDDDVEASDETVSHLVGSVDPDSPQIVIVPCRLRQERPVINVTLDPDSPIERVSKTGARLRRALYGGFGVVSMSRAAVLEIAGHWRDLQYVDDDNQIRLGVFCEFIRNGYWYRDDYAFFARVPPHVRIEALCSGVTDHAGYKLRLENLDRFDHIPLPEAFKRDTQPPGPPVHCAVCQSELVQFGNTPPFCAKCNGLELETTCRQQGGFVSPRLGHVRGMCSLPLGHEGRHSWEPDPEALESEERPSSEPPTNPDGPAARLERFKKFS